MNMYNKYTLTADATDIPSHLSMNNLNNFFITHVYYQSYVIAILGQQNFIYLASYYNSWLHNLLTVHPHAAG